MLSEFLQLLQIIVVVSGKDGLLSCSFLFINFQLFACLTASNSHEDIASAADSILVVIRLDRKLA